MYTIKGFLDHGQVIFTDSSLERSPLHPDLDPGSLEVELLVSLPYPPSSILTAFLHHG
jgi:hypothetical protein